MTTKPLIVMLRDEWDFSIARQPTKFYRIASTPRSGSSWLCHLLWRTGGMGAPAEYFNPRDPMLQMAARPGAQNTRDYVRLLKERRTSPNGVFGFKAHWRQFRFMADFNLLGFFPELRFVRIERRDRVAQSVSDAKAQSLQQWSTLREAKPRTPIYERRRIGQALARVEQDAAAWEGHFRRARVEPVRIIYEEMQADPEAAVAAVLRAFGIEIDPSTAIALPAPGRQADTVNREWIERYLRETG